MLNGGRVAGGRAATGILWLLIAVGAGALWWRRDVPPPEPPEPVSARPAPPRPRVVPVRRVTVAAPTSRSAPPAVPEGPTALPGWPVAVRLPAGWRLTAEAGPPPAFRLAPAGDADAAPSLQLVAWAHSRVESLRAQVAAQREALVGRGSSIGPIRSTELVGRQALEFQVRDVHGTRSRLLFLAYRGKLWTVIARAPRAAGPAAERALNDALAGLRFPAPAEWPSASRDCRRCGGTGRRYDLEAMTRRARRQATLAALAAAAAEPADPPADPSADPSEAPGQQETPPDETDPTEVPDALRPAVERLAAEAVQRAVREVERQLGEHVDCETCRGSGRASR